jgi:hypothetical protein
LTINGTQAATTTVSTTPPTTLMPKFELRGSVNQLATTTPPTTLMPKIGQTPPPPVAATCALNGGVITCRCSSPRAIFSPNNNGPFTCQ